MQDEPSCARALRAAVVKAIGGLRALSDEAAAARPGPGRWSPKEVIGHLVDSASNNHQRFVRARTTSHLLFPGYEQDAWVEGQDYRHAPWNELLDLWESFNLHLARVMATTPPAVRTRLREVHDLEAIAWETVPYSEPVTLDYFMRDYVGHLQHHLRAIDPRLADPPVRQRAGGGPRGS